MSARSVPLAKLAVGSGTGARNATQLPVYSVTKHRGFVPSLEYFKKQVFSRELADYTVVEPGEFAYATIHLDEGSIGIAPERCLISPMYTCFRVLDERVEPRYLVRFLKSPSALVHYPSLGRGTIPRRRAISFERLGSLAVPLPPLDEQRRIADILDRADAMRAKRREAIALSCRLEQSTFVEMFGDPLCNPRRWPTSRLDTVADIVTGNTPPRADEGNYGRHIEWIKSDNIDPALPFLTVAAEGLSVSGAQVARVAPPGATLVTCIAGSQNSIGNAAMADRPVAFNQQINAVVPVSVRPEFLRGWLRTAKRLVQAASTNSMKGMVTKSKLQALSIIVPPVARQYAFGVAVSRIDKLTKTHRVSLAELDALFASLQHRAFRGEL